MSCALGVGALPRCRTATAKPIGARTAALPHLHLRAGCGCGAALRSASTSSAVQSDARCAAAAFDVKNTKFALGNGSTLEPNRTPTPEPTPEPPLASVLPPPLAALSAAALAPTAASISARSDCSVGTADELAGGSERSAEWPKCRAASAFENSDRVSASSADASSRSSAPRSASTSGGAACE